MAAPLPVTLRWIAFSLYIIAWLLFWIATGSNSYRQPPHRRCTAQRTTATAQSVAISPLPCLTRISHLYLCCLAVFPSPSVRSTLTTRFNFGAGADGAYSIPITLGAFEVCAHIDLLSYDLQYLASAPTDCSRIPSGCTTDVYPFGEDDIALPLNYRDSCSTFHAFQAFLILAGLECTVLPFLLFVQLMAYRIDLAQRISDAIGTGTLYRTCIAVPCLVFVTALLSLVCMPTAVDDNWAQVCADILTYNPGSGGGGFDLCQAPAADWGASFDCHVTAVILIAIGLVCYVVGWVQETKTSVAGGAFSETLHVNHSDHYDGGI